MPLSRRAFLGRTALAAPLVLGASTLATSVLLPGGALAAPPRPYGDRTLVLVELGGGNDGLNMVAPHGDPVYRAARPTLGLAEAETLPLGRGLGLNPVMAPLLPLWRDGHLAVVLGVGYPSPNRSHFRSIDIWDTASRSDELLEAGWAARLFTDQPVVGSAVSGVALGSGMGPLIGLTAGAAAIDPNPVLLRLMAGRQVDGSPAGQQPALTPALRHVLATRSDVSAIGTALEQSLDRGDLGVTFPAGPFGAGLEMAARILRGSQPVPLIKVALDGFDTHSNQQPNHTRLLTELAGGLAAFATTLRQGGVWDRVLVMTYSEFGRRVAENASGGTDHGTAAPHLVMGGGVRGGLVGTQPKLSDLDGGDLRFTTDFRSLYATAARGWWGVNGAFADHKLLPLLA